LLADFILAVAAVLAGLLMTGRFPSTWATRTHSLRTAAIDYGRTATPQACVDRAMKLGEPCPRLMVSCAARANLFAYWCLDATSEPPSPELCAAIPPGTDIFGTRDWMKDRCGPRGRDEACGAIGATLQRYCGSRPVPRASGT
jgi:hypothetical protein